MNESVRKAPAGTTDVIRLSFLALSRWLAVIALLGLLIFVPAGTPDYWQGWVYLAILGLSSLFFIAYYLKADPELIERRMKYHEKEREQRRIMRFSIPLFGLAFVIPGLDQRFGWSSATTGVVLTADAILVLGYLLFARVMQVNRYASRVIEVEEGQQLITTGPYAMVRHPMYVAALTIYVISPLALASYWGLAVSVWFVPVLVARIRNEEKVLRDELPGYEEYCRRTRYRLIPQVW